MTRNLRAIKLLLSVLFLVGPLVAAPGSYAAAPVAAERRAFAAT